MTVVKTAGKQQTFGCQKRGFRPTAPVSHQKLPQQSATNAIKGKRKHSEINEADRFTAAHNGLVAGSNAAGPTGRTYTS
jgi:hypothetical protein